MFPSLSLGAGSWCRQLQEVHTCASSSHHLLLFYPGSRVTRCQSVTVHHAVNSVRPTLVFFRESLVAVLFAFVKTQLTSASCLRSPPALLHRQLPPRTRSSHAPPRHHSPPAIPPTCLRLRVCPAPIPHSLIHFCAINPSTFPRSEFCVLVRFPPVITL